MADTAAHLVDRLLPQIPYRQYVLTFPWPLRLPLAVQRGLLGEMLRVYLRTLFAWQRRRGRALGIRDGQTGAITFVQFFGGALNLNPHSHSILPDGLFVPSEQGALTFVPLPSPSDDDIARLTRKLAARLGALANRRLSETEDLATDVDDEEAHVHAALAEAQHVPRSQPGDIAAAETQAKHCCAQVDGFTLHAARTVAEHDREGLEKLCKYGLRAPFAVERFSMAQDGRVCYRLPKPWPTPRGQTELRLEPRALLRRLAALIPAPYFNLVRCYGVFAPSLLKKCSSLQFFNRVNEHGRSPRAVHRSRFRKALPSPPPPATPTEPPPLPAATQSPENLLPEDPPPLRPRRLPWAQLLRRAMHIDALTCPRCSVPMVVLAFISDPKVVKRILAHLKLPTSPPPLSPPRLVEQEEMFGDDTSDLTDSESLGVAQNAHAPRGPPRR